MSLDYQNLCCKILLEYFGDVVAKVSEILLRNNLSTLGFICSESKLPKSKVQASLCVLIKHNLVIWNELRPGIPSYHFLSDRIPLLLRFPRYLWYIQELFGKESEMVVDTITREGQITASQIIICSCLKLMEASAEVPDKGFDDRHITVRNALAQLIEKHFVQQCPNPENNDESSVQKTTAHAVDNFYRFKQDSIDLKVIQMEIQARVNSEEGFTFQASKTLYDHPDSKIFWRLNYDQFHLEFRDIEICNSMSRRIDPLAGACLRAILKVSYTKSDPWQDKLNTVTASELEHSKNSSQLEQYLRVIVENGGGCLQKLGDAGGGEYAVNIGAVIKSITLSTIENIVQERYGSKAARMFRLIKEKRMMEQDHVIKISMIENKEANRIMSQLLQDGFLQLHELRKNLNHTPSKQSIFLYYVDANAIVLSLLEWCYKTLFNLMVQRDMRFNQHKRLLDKKAREEILIENLKQSGANDEQIKDIEESLTPAERELVKNVLEAQDKLLDRETSLDEMMFIFQMYSYYHIFKP